MSMTVSESRNNTPAVPAIAKPRLPYHPALQDRFGIGINEWRALVDAVFPSAKEPSSVILALSYCQARKLDPFKKPIHIVPVWNSDLGRMVETVWPGIGELRTTAFRTGQYAGRDPAEYGPTVTSKVGKREITYPEWCQVTVYRMLGGQRMPFPGPRVYWMESYAVTKRDDPSPNSMWTRRPYGQLDKCAEAASLRGAFPEEIGNEMTADEMEGKSIGSGHDAAPASQTVVENPLSDDDPPALAPPPQVDWRDELETYQGDLAEADDLRALDVTITRDGARFVDAPADIQAEAKKIEGAERARVERAAA